MKNFLNHLRLFVQIQKGLLLKYGWLRAWRCGRPVDANGDPVPWITYPALDYIAQFDFSDAAVFEWGSGSSSIWWSKRCRRITTVESNQEFASFIKDLLPPMVDLIVTPKDVEAEVAALQNHINPVWDIIVIDNHGPFRKRCAEAAADHLAEGGWIILDNSDQCLIACDILRGKGFIQIDFSGFAPGNGYAQCTSLFFKTAPKFVAVTQPMTSPAQPNLPWPDC